MCAQIDLNKNLRENFNEAIKTNNPFTYNLKSIVLQ